MKQRNVGFESLVTIQGYSETENAYGEQIKDWADIRDEYSHFDAGSGGEQRIAAREQGVQMATFTFWANDLTKAIRPETHRLKFNGVVWDILTVPPPEGSLTINITAKAGTS